MDKTIQYYDWRLADLRAKMPIYRGSPNLENWLASEIIDLQLQRIEHLRSYPPPVFIASIIPLTSTVPLPSYPVQHIMPAIITHRKAPKLPNHRAYLQPGQPVGARISFFRQIQYLPLPNAEPDFDQALTRARHDCGQDLHRQLKDFDGAAKVRITVQVEYEPVNPMVNKQPFEQYLSAAPTRIFQRDGPVTDTENPYIDSLRILTDRIREFNAKFICDKSGL